MGLRRIVTMLFGLALLALVLWVGWEPLQTSLAAAGWSLLWVLPLHVAADAIDSVGWRGLLHPRRRPSASYVVWVALMRDAAASLIPVASAMATVLGAGLLTARGLRFVPAFASIVVESSLSLISQAVFVLASALACTALLDRRLPLDLMAPLALATLAAGFLFLLLQRYRTAYLWLIHQGSRLPLLARFSRVLPGRFYAALHRIHRRPRVLWACVGWQVLSLAVGALELWLMLHLLGYRSGLAVPFLLQAATRLSRSVGFVVPAGLGVQEGVFAAVAAACGLPAGIGLSLSLLSRCRDLLQGAPLLLAWWLRRAAMAPETARATIRQPASAGDT
jgi:putative membrane protein